MKLTRDQLRAARALLKLDQAELAELSAVAVATLRRYESGLQVGDAQLDKLREALVAAGAMLIEPGTAVGDTTAGIGVALLEDALLPEATRRRISAAEADAGRRRPPRNPATPEQPRPGRPRKPKAPEPG